MNISEHTRILKAYIDRMTIADLDRICEANRSAWNQAMNGNANSQREAYTALYSEIMNTLENLVGRDLDNIAVEINRIINRE